jgi:hypothetical protein
LLLLLLKNKQNFSSQRKDIFGDKSLKCSMIIYIQLNVARFVVETPRKHSNFD